MKKEKKIEILKRMLLNANLRFSECVQSNNYKGMQEYKYIINKYTDILCDIENGKQNDNITL